MSHLSTLNPLLLDPSRPTLFELVSASQLSDLLSPTVRYILASLASRHPRYLLRLVLHFDELYALLSAAIELRCLKLSNASFTESFYDLARRRVLKADRAVVAASGSLPSVQHKVDRLAALRPREIYSSLFALVGLPYILTKLDLYYESLQAASVFRSHAQRSNPDDSNADPIARRKLKLKLFITKYFAKLYPSLKLSASTISLLLSILYLFGRTPYHSLTDFLLAIRYTRQSPDSAPFSSPSRSSSSSSSSSLSSPSPLRKLIALALRASDLTLKGVLPTAVFALKLLEWWHASDFPRQLAQSTRRRQREELQQQQQQQQQLDEMDAENDEQSAEEPKYALDPPDLPSPTSDTSPDDDKETNEQCAICHHKIKEPTAIETGQVFCYSCIYSYINSSAANSPVRCPVTKQRLLLCRYDAVTESWLVGGLRRLVV
ncbi:Pex12 amino terminal region-domain-containing protein [Myxozyma melibiosi]|uniref:Peroxisome assembly protein 12 n=1 Tax=Myxozyma melibiosi TaxID=54550 RepID=A0ABR1EZL9_9ASCO